MTKTDLREDAISFAGLLKEVRLSGRICVGDLSFSLSEGVSDEIRYSKSAKNLIKGCHEYTVVLPKGDLQVSLQLYRNSSEHYHLFCYVRFGKDEGMVFSLNLTTAKEENNMISLVQKIKFIERYEEGEQITAEYRKKKQANFCDLLRCLGFDISNTNDVTFGTYDTFSSTLIGTTAQKFLNDFLIVSILKGSFQGNKGYRIEIDA